jgi:hypothetical protein
MNVPADRRSLSRLGLTALLCLPLIAAEVWAAPVSSERAETVARNWMLLQTGVAHSAQRLERPVAAGAEAATNPPQHILIETDPAGWVIVAGDDTTYPVLGYATGSSIAGQVQPPSFVNWMRLVDDSIAEAARRTAAGAAQPEADAQAIAATIAQSWTELGQSELQPSAQPRREGSVGAVAPLIRTTWSQDRFYNAACPADGASAYDGRALVGCCATALGQIMRYHAYPASGTGSNSYYHVRYGTLSANFGATEYQWAAMPASGRLTSYNNAVALLLRHAGIAVDMDYGPQASGCNIDRITPALRNYFRYAAEDIAARATFADATWISKIKADLNARRPIWYAGFGAGEGHAFVLDGYTDNNYFHFNWGWNGAYDGYFLLSNLNPGGSSFTSSQHAVFGIRPASPRPAAARLMSPSGVIATRTPTYSWGAVSNARRYYLWVDDPTSGGNGKIKARYSAAQVGCGGGTGICSVRPTTQLANGPATWWIQTWNEAGDGPWSAPMGFRVNVGTPPGPATLLNPSGTIRTTLPTYTWPAVSGASAYMLWVDDVTSNDSGKIQTWYSAAQVGCGSGVGTCAVTPETALANGRATWWIQTRNAFGYGPWSAPKTFTVDAVGAATLIDPSGLVTISMPTYRWQPVPGATWYQLWVDDVTSGGAGKIQSWYTASQAACSTGICSVQPAIQLANGPATWWIQTWNEAGDGPWSDAQDFLVNVP